MKVLSNQLAATKISPCDSSDSVSTAPAAAAAENSLRSKPYLLSDPDWPYADLLPWLESLDRLNVSDFALVDEEIDKRLRGTEAEEETLQQAAEAREKWCSAMMNSTDSKQWRRFSNQKPVLPRAQRREHLHTAANEILQQ